MKRCLRLILRGALLSVVGVQGIAAYVLTVGIPGPLVRRYLDRTENAQGLRITVDRVRWSPWHHITAHGVRLATPGGVVAADFRSVEIDLSPGRNSDSELQTVRYRVSDGLMRFSGAEGQPPASVRLAECDLACAPDGRIRFNAEATLSDRWHLTVSGRRRGPAHRQTMAAPSTLGERAAELGGRAYGVLRSLDESREKGFLPESLSARVMLEVDAEGFQTSKVWAFLGGGPVRIRGLALDDCSAVLRWTDGLVRIDNFRAGSPGSGLSLQGYGTFSPGSRDVDAALSVQASPADLVAAGLLSTNHTDAARLFGALEARLDLVGNLREPAAMGVTIHATSPDAGSDDVHVNVEHLHGSYSNGVIHVESLRLASRDPMACLPAHWTDSLLRAGLRSLGPLRVDVSLGPAPVTAVLSNITGRATCAAAGYRGATLEQIALGFRRHGGETEITHATAALHVGGQIRSLRGHGTLTAADSYGFHLETEAEPELLSAFLPTNVAPLVASLKVAGISRTEVDLLRRVPRATDLTIRGTIHATDVTRHDVPMDLVHASFAYGNGTFQVDDVALVRRDGQVTGQFAYRTAERLLSVDGRSTVPPMAIARFIGPALERGLAPYRVEGPTAVEGKGSIGLRGNPARDLRLRIEGEQLGWRWFLADQAAMVLRLEDRATLVEELNARWCGGDVSGSVRVDKPSPTNTAGRCSVALLVDGADLATAVGVFRNVEDRKAYAGTLSGQVTLSGAIGSGFAETATGSGRVGIQDGYLLSIPFFGGLSKYLSALIPGLGYANQRDLRGSFQVRGGRMETTDAELLGKLITIRGKGSYGFGKDLDLRVQVQFLKEGLTATVTRLITSPLTKALEFEVTGTPKDPRWRPVNTPDRLLKFFGEKLGALVPAKREALPDETGFGDQK